MPEPRRRTGAIVGEAVLLLALAAVAYLAWRRYSASPDWPFWVLAGFGLVLLVAWVLGLIATVRRGRPVVVPPTDESESSRATSGETAAVEPVDSAPAALDEPAAAQPAVDHTPMVPADEAIGYGWAKASDLARTIPNDQG